MLQGLVFLHEKRVAHRDIFETNIVMNALVHPDVYYYDLRDPASVRYAYIDYDAALILPEATDIGKVTIPRAMRAQNCYMRAEPGLCNPFQDDVRALAYTLERSIRVGYSPLPSTRVLKRVEPPSTLKTRFLKSALSLSGWSEGKRVASPWHRRRWQSYETCAPV